VSQYFTKRGKAVKTITRKLSSDVAYTRKKKDLSSLGRVFGKKRVELKIKTSPTLKVLEF